METKIHLTTKQKNKINRALKALEEVRSDVASTSDNFINWYLEDTANLHLMDGDSHDDKGSALQGMSIDCFFMNAASGGGW